MPLPEAGELIGFPVGHQDLAHSSMSGRADTLDSGECAGIASVSCRENTEGI